MDDEAPLGDADARNLRFLRLLVLALTATMIVGMVVLIALFATRFPGGARGAMPLDVPASLDLPDGADIAAVTQSPTMWIVVTGAGEILFYAAEGGAPVRRIEAPQ